MKPKLPPVKYLRQLFDYDVATGNTLWKERPASHFRGNHFTAKRWNSKNAGKPAGYVDKSVGRTLVKIDGKSYTLSRVVWKMSTGYDPAYFIEHLNGIQNDDRMNNLRDIPLHVIKKFGSKRRVKLTIKDNKGEHHENES